MEDEDKEALHEWVSRGLPRDEFSLAKMLEVWEKEHEAAVHEHLMRDMMGGNLAEKQQVLKKKADEAITVKRVKNELKKMGKTAFDEVADVVYDIGGLIEPGWVKRAKRKRRNLRRIRKAEEAADQYDKDKKDHLHELLSKQMAIEKMRKQRKKVLKKAKPTEDLKEVALEEQAKDVRKQEIDAFVARRKADHDEKEAKYKAMIDAEKEKHEKQLQEMRSANLDIWTKHAVSAKEEAEKLKGKLDQDRATRRKQVVKDLEEERLKKEVAWEYSQVDGPAISEDREGLGIFGVPQDPGAFHASIDGGHLPGVDEHTVGGFMENLHPDYEMKHNKLIEREAERDKKEQLYISLTDNLYEIEEDLDTLTQLKDRLQTDCAQMQLEHDEMIKKVFNPPLRDFTPDEVAANNFRLENIAKMKRSIAEIDEKTGVLEEKMKPMEAQSLRVAQELAMLRQEAKDLREEVEGHNQGLGELPMIVGKSITKVEGIGIFRGKPKESLNYINLKSKAALLKEQSRDALKVHREARRQDNKLWINQQQKLYSEDALEGMLNRLAAATDRLKRSKAQDIQQSLVQALKLFFTNKEKLKVVNAYFEGTVQWWSSRDPTRTFNIEPWGGIKETAKAVTDIVEDDVSEISEDLSQPGTMEESLKTDESKAPIPDTVGSEDKEVGLVGFDGLASPKEGAETPVDASEDPLSIDAFLESEEEVEDVNRQGVSLGSARIGVLIGVFKFPKYDLWKVQFAVTRRDPFDLTHGDRTDWVSVKLGPSPMNLKPVAQFKNEPVDEDAQDVRHEITYAVRSTELAYRFDFSSSMLQEEVHMAIEPARYETFQLEPLEERDDGRVLSSYVKLLKVEAKTGDMKHTNILVDVVNAMESKEPFWDSDVLNDTPQRYNREGYVKLATEVLMAMKKEKESLMGGSLNTVQDRMGNLKIPDTKEEARLKRVKDSAKRYIERKRAHQWPMVEAEQAKENKVYAVFDDVTQKWIYMKILACNVKWIENGTLAVCRHILQEIDRDSGMPVADPVQKDMSLLRCYETKAIAFDEDAKAAFEKFSADFKDMLGAKRQSKANIEIIGKQRAENYAKEKRRFERAKGVALGREREKRTKEAEVLAGTAPVLAEIASAERVLLHQLRAGIGVEQKRNATMKDARREALRRWKQEYIEECLEVKAKKLEARYEEHIQKIDDKLREEQEELERRHILLEAELKRRRDEMTAKRRAEVKELVAKIRIPNFEKAVPQNKHCEHLRSRAWGDLYGKGERCLDCGRELTMLHHEKTQQEGIGSGEDPSLMRAITQHRKNENSFRFESSEQLQLIEQERRRLEKERRAIKESEVFFYDLEEAKFVYEFDRRHKVYFKEHGVFRQGVQWTEEELEKWRKDREDAIREMSPRSQLEASKSLNDYMELLNMPTYRQYDAKRYAHFQDIMYTFSRIYNFRLRLKELKQYRVDLILERGEREDQLKYLHQEIVRTENHHKLVAGDLARATRILQIRKDVIAHHIYTMKVLKAARKDKRQAEIERAGVEDTAIAMEEHAIEMGKQNRELLRHRIREEILLKKLTKKANTYRRKEQKKIKELEKCEERLETFLYKSRGSLVPTPYGKGIVMAYRKQDEFLIVKLPFCYPNAYVYVKLADCITIDRSIAQATKYAMEKEEEELRKFYQEEKKKYFTEQKIMEAEDKAMKALLVLEKEEQWETGFLQASIKEGEYFGTKMIRKREGKAIIERRVEVKLKVAVEARERAIERWMGYGLRPKPMTVKEMKKFVKEHRQECKEEFLQQHADLSRWTAEMMLIFRRTEKMQAVVCAEFIEEFLFDFMQDIAKDSIDNGMFTKDTAEKSTGIVFSDPRHMQYSIYYTLKAWWIERKLALQNQLQLWGVQVAKETDRWEEERKKHAAMEAEMKRREDEAAEKRRQDTLCREMLEEEQNCRKFYKWELKRMLEERRAMMAAEQEMRIYVKNLEIMETHRKQDLFKQYGTDQVQTVIQEGSTLELRRLEIKHQKVEKRRMDKEKQQMQREDELAYQVRAEAKKAEQLKKLREEMALLGGEYMAMEVDVDITSETDSEYYSSEESALTHSETESEIFAEKRRLIRDAGSLKHGMAGQASESEDLSDSEEEEESEDEDSVSIGSSMLSGSEPSQRAPAAQRTIEPKPKKKKKKKPKKTAKEIERELRKERRKDRQRIRRIKLLRWAKRKREAAEKLAAEEIEAARLKTLIEKAKVELDWMESEEEAKLLEEDQRISEVNVRRLTLHSDSRGRDELDSKHKARVSRKISNACVKKDEDAAAWVKLCEKDELLWRKKKERVLIDTEFMDTLALTGFYQRWLTDLLHGVLYELFFRTFVNIIATRAETVGCERRAMKVQEMLMLNKKMSVEKDQKMTILWKKHQRSELMRLRRSELGKRLFGHTQKNILKVALGGWIWFTRWVKSLKSAFELKFNVVKHDLNIDQAFPEVSKIMDKKTINVPETQDEGPGLPKSMLTKYKERPVQCRHCKQFYLEDQNTDISCAFHTGEYKMACPRDCTGLTTTCMSHRSKRWTCCDNREKGNRGCQVRFHVPPDVDPAYHEAVAKIDRDDQEENKKLDEELEEIKKYNWKLQAFKIKHDQIGGIEQRLVEDRKVVSQYEKMLRIR